MVDKKMLDVAERVLKELGIKKMSKRYSNRDILFEAISAALTISGKVESFSEDVSLSKSEEEWSQFFSDCKVIVKDPEVGRQLLQKGLQSTEAFAVLIESVVKDKAVVVSLNDYPGITLFKDKGKPLTSTIDLGTIKKSLPEGELNENE